MDPNCVKTCATCKHDAAYCEADPGACAGCLGWCNFESKDEPVKAPTSALDVQVGGGHYKAKGIQPIEYIFANKLGFCEGNVVKYVTRYPDKNGVEDLKKARHYLDMLIERLEKA